MARPMGFSDKPITAMVCTLSYKAMISASLGNLYVWFWLAFIANSHKPACAGHLFVPPADYENLLH